MFCPQIVLVVTNRLSLSIRQNCAQRKKQMTLKLGGSIYVHFPYVYCIFQLQMGFAQDNVSWQKSVQIHNLWNVSQYFS